MKIPESLRIECKKAWENYKESEDTIVLIIKLREIMKQRGFANFDTDELSRIQGELSVLKSRIGELCSEEIAVANSAYIYRKWRSYKVFKNLRNTFNATVADAQADADLVVESEFEEQILSQYIADMLKTMYESTSDLVVSIQVRIKNLNGERIESKYNGRP